MVHKSRLVTTLVVLLAVASVGHGRRDQAQYPTGLTPNPTALAYQATGSVLVQMNAVATSATVVTVSASPAVLSMPITVTVPSGSSSVSFNVTNESTTGQSVTITATANGQEVSKPMPVQGPRR